MQIKTLIMAIIMGMIPVPSFGVEGSRMVCLHSATVTGGQDQSPLACRYHVAYTVTAFGAKKVPYRCYIQFKNEDGVKLLDIPSIFQKVAPNLDLKHLDEDPKANKEKAEKALSDATTKFVLTTNSLPVQAKLAITTDDDGEQVLTTGAGNRRLFIQFSDPYPQEKFAILKKANAGVIPLEELAQVVPRENYASFEKFIDLVPHLQQALPCMGCIDLNSECIKK